MEGQGATIHTKEGDNFMRSGSGLGWKSDNSLNDLKKIVSAHSACMKNNLFSERNENFHVSVHK